MPRDGYACGGHYRPGIHVARNMIWNAEEQMLPPTYAARGSDGNWYVHGGIACLCSGTEQQMRNEIERIRQNHAANFRMPIWC